MISKERKDKVLFLSNDHTSLANGCIKTISIKNKCQKKVNSSEVMHQNIDQSHLHKLNDKFDKNTFN